MRRRNPETWEFLGGLGLKQRENVRQFLANLGQRQDGWLQGARMGILACRMIELVAGTADGKVLLVQQLPDAAAQQYFMMLIVTPVTAPLDRFELRKLLLPVTQHMRLHAAQLADFPNREVALGRYRGQDGQHGFTGTVIHVRQTQARLTNGAVPPFSTMLFSFWLAWKVTTRRAVMGMASPVLGLRPGRCGLSRS